MVSITIFEPYTCNPAIHYKAKPAHSVAYLADHRRAAIIDNRNITAAQIWSSGRLEHGDPTGYLQAC
jgi:hypothetical protein